jgi:hypothetical protein
MSEQRTSTGGSLPPSPDYISMRDVAAYCCVTVATVSRGTRSGTWPFSLLRRVEIGGRVIFTRASFSHMCRAMKAAADVVSISERREKSA